MIIKPDAVKNGHVGSILQRIEQESFKILGLRSLFLTREQAEEFYTIHKERPFFASLVGFMTSGMVIAGALAAPEAVKKWRNLIGATDPLEAAENTIRKLYAQNKEWNAVHGSDSDENAKQEIAFFFTGMALVGNKTPL